MKFRVTGNRAVREFSSPNANNNLKSRMILPTLIFYVFYDLVYVFTTLLTYVIKFFLLHRNLTRTVALRVATSKKRNDYETYEKKSVTTKETV